MTIDYDNPWVYKGVPISSTVASKYFGFVYEIVDKETNEKYIGRKYLWKKKKIPGSIRKKKVESDWKTYYSSHEGLKKIGKENPNRLSREILHFCSGQRRDQLS